MKTNRKKIIICSKDYENINIKMDDDALKQVTKFKYISSVFTKDGKNKEDIIKRIKEAKVIFNIKSNFSDRITLACK